MSSAAVFGELRELLHTQPTRELVERVCESIADALVEEPHFLAQHLEYVRDLSRSWPTELKRAPTWFTSLCVELLASEVLDLFDTTTVTCGTDAAYILEHTDLVIDRVELASSSDVSAAFWRALSRAPARIELAKLAAPASAITKDVVAWMAQVKTSPGLEISLHEITSHSAQERAAALLEVVLARGLSSASLSFSSDPLTTARDTSRLWGRLAGCASARLERLEIAGIMITSREAGVLGEWLVEAAPSELILRDVVATTPRVVADMVRGAFANLEAIVVEGVREDVVTALLSGAAQLDVLTSIKLVACRVGFVSGALERVLRRSGDLEVLEVFEVDPIHLSETRRWLTEAKDLEFVVNLGLLDQLDASP